MEATETMCIFLAEVQEEYNEAVCIFRARYDVTAIAKACGLNPRILRNKLNPQQPHVLSLSEMMAISKTANDYVILEVVLRNLDLVTAHIPPSEEKETFIKRALNNSILAGELSQLALDNAGRKSLPRSTRNSIIENAQAGISNLMLLISDLESRTGSATPFFSMGIDFIASGAPLPGFA